LNWILTNQSKVH